MCGPIGNAHGREIATKGQERRPGEDAPSPQADESEGGAIESGERFCASRGRGGRQDSADHAAGNR
jgi:hypothetical protein